MSDTTIEPKSEIEPKSDGRKPTFKDRFWDAVNKEILTDLKRASEQKQSYIHLLKEASGEDVFKYLLLINVSALEAYVAQTRIQAQQSFNASKWAAGVGFALIIFGIALGIYASYMFDPAPGKENTILPAAYLSGIAGILSEFISGIFLYIYNRTLEQLNLFHEKLISSQQTSMAFLANNLIPAGDKRNDCTAELSKVLMSKAIGRT